MATFSAASFVAAANGNIVEPGPVHFVTSQTTKAAGNTAAGAASQLAAHQQHIYHQSVAQQQVRHNLTGAGTIAPADSPPSSSQSATQQQNTMQQAFQVRNLMIIKLIKLSKGFFFIHCYLHGKFGLIIFFLFKWL